MAWLDYDGLLYFWQKIKEKLANKVDKVEGKGLSTNDFTTEEKNNLTWFAYEKIVRRITQDYFKL